MSKQDNSWEVWNITERNGKSTNDSTQSESEGSFLVDSSSESNVNIASHVSDPSTDDSMNFNKSFSFFGKNSDSKEKRKKFTTSLNVGKVKRWFTTPKKMNSDTNLANNKFNSLEDLASNKIASEEKHFLIVENNISPASSPIKTEMVSPRKNSKSETSFGNVGSPGNKETKYSITFTPESTSEQKLTASKNEENSPQKNLLALLVGVGLGEESKDVVSNAMSPHSIEEHGRFNLRGTNITNNNDDSLNASSRINPTYGKNEDEFCMVLDVDYSYPKFSTPNKSERGEENALENDWFGDDENVKEKQVCRLDFEDGDLNEKGMQSGTSNGKLRLASDSSEPESNPEFKITVHNVDNCGDEDSSPLSDDEECLEESCEQKKPMMDEAYDFNHDGRLASFEFHEIECMSASGSSGPNSPFKQHEQVEVEDRHAVGDERKMTLELLRYMPPILEQSSEHDQQDGKELANGKQNNLEGFVEINIVNQDGSTNIRRCIEETQPEKRLEFGLPIESTEPIGTNSTSAEDRPIKESLVMNITTHKKCLWYDYSSTSNQDELGDLREFKNTVLSHPLTIPHSHEHIHKGIYIKVLVPPITTTAESGKCFCTKPITADPVIVSESIKHSDGEWRRTDRRRVKDVRVTEVRLKEKPFDVLSFTEVLNEENKYEDKEAKNISQLIYSKKRPLKTQLTEDFTIISFDEGNSKHEDKTLSEKFGSEFNKSSASFDDHPSALMVDLRSKHLIVDDDPSALMVDLNSKHVIAVDSVNRGNDDDGETHNDLNREKTQGLMNGAVEETSELVKWLLSHREVTDEEDLANIYIELASRYSKDDDEHLVEKGALLYESITDEKFSRVVERLFAHIQPFTSFKKEDSTKTIGTDQLLKYIEKLIETGEVKSKHIEQIAEPIAKPNFYLSDHSTVRLNLLKTCFVKEAARMKRLSACDYLLACFDIICRYFVLLDDTVCNALTSEYVVPYLNESNAEEFIVGVVQYMGLLKCEWGAKICDDVSAPLLLLHTVLQAKNMTSKSKKTLSAFLQISSKTFQFARREKEMLRESLKT